MYSDSLYIFKILFPEAVSDPVFSAQAFGGNSLPVTDTTALNRRRYSIGTTYPLYIFPEPIIARSMNIASTTGGPSNLGVELFFKYF